MRPASDLVLTALARDPARPRLTAYAADGARTELSGASLAQAVAKAAGAASDELGLGPGDLLGLDVGLHWQAVVWALAAWQVGAGVCVDATGATLTLRAAPAPAAPPASGPDPVVTLGPWGGPAPGAGTSPDAGALAQAAPDVFTPSGWPQPTDPALRSGGVVWTHEEWASATVAAGAAAGGARRLVTAAPADADGWLAGVLGPLLGGGSVVLHAGSATAAAADAAREGVHDLPP